jgi:OFA family oxalate/formate antiporter-like MFS transporter
MRSIMWFTSVEQKTQATDTSEQRMRKGSPERSRIFYGWWIVAAAFLAMLAHAGSYYCFGVFFKPVQLELGWMRADVSWAIFLQQVVHGASYILVGTLIDRHGPRKVMPPFAMLLFVGYALVSQTSALWHLYLFYGGFVGIGYGIGYAPLASIVARWFDRRKGLALGIAASGIAVGTMIVPPLASYFILYTGWRVAFIIIGLILLVIFLAVAFILKGSPQEKGLAPYGYQELSFPQHVATENNISPSQESGVELSDALRSRQLWIIIIAFGAFFFGQQMVMFHIVNYATDIGISATLAASILSFVGIGGLVGRLAFGGLSDVVGVKRLLLVCLAGMTILLACLILIKSMALFTAFGLIFGFLYGGVVPLQAALINRVFGSKAMGAILGAVVFGQITAAAVGPLLAGYIFDATQSYTYAFAFGAILAGVAAILSLLLKVPVTNREDY